MNTLFFPSPLFGWLFIVVLLALLSIACRRDVCSLTIPKWLTLITLAVGLLASLARGTLLAVGGFRVWLFGSSGPTLGLFDGLLFSLCGFGVAFVVLFVLWMLRLCDGGDVKLVSAIGAWVGPEWVFGVLGAALVFLALLLVVGQGGAFLRGTSAQTQRAPFAPPLTLGTAVVLLLILVRDGHFAQQV